MRYDEYVTDFQLSESQGSEKIVPEWFVELLLSVNGELCA